MLSGIVPSTAARSLSSGVTAQPTAVPNDAFSQQLLAIIQNSLEKLGYAKSAVQVQSHAAGVAGSSGATSPVRQFLVTVPVEVNSSEKVGVEEPGNGKGSFEKACSDEPPAVLFEEHEGFTYRFFATREAAEWAAARFGGEVGISQWEWSPWVTPPPPFYTIRFGDKEINAGLLVQYFEPGRFVGADQEAALALFREGIVNDYVLQYRPELIAEFGMPA